MELFENVPEKIWAAFKCTWEYMILFENVCEK